MFLKQAIKNSDGLPCVSQVTADKLKYYFPRLKPQQEVEVVYNYVDFEKLEIKAPAQIAENSKFILSVAQHRQNKNLDLLIKAYAGLLKSDRLDGDCKLFIVGSSGPETESIKNLIASFNLESKVSLLSGISDRELGWLYQNCYAFIIPSSTEGFCLPLAEALHFSDCVVCSDIPIFREITTSNCQYFSLEGDAVSNLSQALIQAIENPRLPDKNAIERFNKSHIAQQYLNLYDRVRYKSPARLQNRFS